MASASSPYPKNDSLDPQLQIKQVDDELRLINEQILNLQRKKHKLTFQRLKLCDAVQQEKSIALSQKKWDKPNFSWSVELQQKLESAFRIKQFRAHQLSTINATLSNINCILIMPTGGGKSLCYQLPALVSKGFTLVVSPLISLMEDQIMGLTALSIDAEMLSGSSTKEQVNKIHMAMTDPKATLKLLYVTPEKLSKSKRFMTKLQKAYQAGRFSRLAIDEVHCCSQWGHDFRPDYKYLGIMRGMFPNTPILGLTATATSRVIQDVQKILKLKDCLVLKASFNRPNLFYEVRPKASIQHDSIMDVASLLQDEFKGQSGIVYTMTIKDTDELVKGLRGLGLKVAAYHAQLTAERRSQVHRKWVNDEYQAVVATIAFGMGIDKPNVRFVIHHCVSKSMENFYQESGRAGRDSKPARCILFWRFADLFRQSTMVFTEQTGLENLYGIVTYCLDAQRCRRNVIAEHFDECWEASHCRKMCDHCADPCQIRKVPVAQYGIQLLNILKFSTTSDQRLTGLKLVDLWLGKGPTNMRVKESTAKGLARELAENVVSFLLVDEYLKEDFHFTPYSTISYIVPGPKAEAGLEPSNMEVPSCANNANVLKRKVSDVSSSKMKKKDQLNCSSNHSSVNNEVKKQKISIDDLVVIDSE